MSEDNAEKVPYSTRLGGIPTPDGRFPIEPGSDGLNFRRKRRPFINIAKNDEKIRQADAARFAREAEESATLQIAEHEANETNLVAFIAQARANDRDQKFTNVEILKQANDAFVHAEQVVAERAVHVSKFAEFLEEMGDEAARITIGPRRFDRWKAGDLSLAELEPVMNPRGEGETPTFEFLAPQGDDIIPEPVPQSFGEWLKSKDDEHARRILGDERFDQWKAGELDFSALKAITPDGNVHLLEISAEVIPFFEDLLTNGEQIIADPEPEIVEEIKAEPEVVADKPGETTVESSPAETLATATETAGQTPDTSPAPAGDSAPAGNAETATDAAPKVEGSAPAPEAPKTVVPPPPASGKGKGGKSNK